MNIDTYIHTVQYVSESIRTSTAHSCRILTILGMAFFLHDSMIGLKLKFKTMT